MPVIVSTDAAATHIGTDSKTRSHSPGVSSVSTAATPKMLEELTDTRAPKIQIEKSPSILKSELATKMEHDTGAPEGFEVFVGRMPLNTTEQQLSDLACPFSPIEVRILQKPDRSSHLCGFVVFDSINKAQGFIAGYNGRLALGGHYPLNVRFSDGKSRKKVFIGGLAAGTREEDLRSLTQAFGTILATKILSKNQKALCGFVTFATGEQAEVCIKEMHNTPNADDSKKYVVKLAKAPESSPEEGNSSKGKGKGKGKRKGRPKGQKRGRDASGGEKKRRRGNFDQAWNSQPQEQWDSGYNTGVVSDFQPTISECSTDDAYLMHGPGSFDPNEVDCSQQQFFQLPPPTLLQPVQAADGRIFYQQVSASPAAQQQQFAFHTDDVSQAQNASNGYHTPQAIFGNASPLQYSNVVHLHNLPHDLQMYQVQQL